MKQNLIYAVCVVLFFACSCSKDNNNPDSNTINYRLVKKTFDNGKLENYYYLENGLLRQITVSGEGSREFIYDSENKLTKVIIETLSKNYSEKYFYDDELISFIIFSLDSDKGLSDTVFFKYDNENRISQIVKPGPHGSNKNTLVDFLYDNENRLIESTSTISVGNLTFADVIEYLWNSVGNILEAKRTFFFNDEQTSVVQVNYDYDSFLNYNSTITYPEAYILRKKYLQTINEEFSKNNMVERKQSGDDGSSIYLYRVTKNENGFPTRIERDEDSFDLLYEER